MSSSNRPIQSVERAMFLLEMLKEHPQGASLAELCEPLHLSKSTAHGLLRTLADMGYVSQQGGLYISGLRAHTLAPQHHSPGTDLRQRFTPALRAFNELCGADCFLTVASGNRTYLTLAGLNRAGLPLVLPTDTQRDALRTSAAGKVLMANDPALARQVRRLAPLDRSLEQELLQIAERGFALDVQSALKDLNCMAIPLRHKGKVVGALGTSGAPNELDPASMQLMAKRALRELCTMVSC